MNLWEMEFFMKRKDVYTPLVPMNLQFFAEPKSGEGDGTGGETQADIVVKHGLATGVATKGEEEDDKVYCCFFLHQVII